MLVQQPDESIRTYSATAKGFKDATAGFSLWCISLSERSKLCVNKSWQGFESEIPGDGGRRLAAQVRDRRMLPAGTLTGPN